MNKCAGVVGLLFGHKYLKTKGGWVYKSDSCYRCGKVRGA